MSKGSRPRPYSISQNEFANNYDRIFRKPDPKATDDEKAWDEAFDEISRRSLTNNNTTDNKDIK
jgi:hypothetical protein